MRKENSRRGNGNKNKEAGRSGNGDPHRGKHDVGKLARCFKGMKTNP